MDTAEGTRQYQLTDGITQSRGTAFMTGVQALARIPIEQLRVDRADGLNTAALASGYPGSPLAGLDKEFARASSLAPELPFVARPALNEELGVAAVMGSQVASTRPDAKYDGVLGIWYGKAPGLDRSSDALRHAVFAGTSHMGGAIAIVGDDPSAKSSTLPSSSDATFVDLHLPILYPADVSEALELGRHAVALSRATGLWAGLKIVTAVADGSSSVSLDIDRIQPIIPLIDGQPYVCVPDGLLLGAHSLEVEKELRGIRTELAVEYGRLNKLNQITVESKNPWLGIIASGLTYRELMEALRRLGLGKFDLGNAGIRVLEMKMPIPFAPAVVRNFAKDLPEVMVVEEMNPTLESRVKDALYGVPNQPRVTGKVDRDGEPQIPGHGPLDADRLIEPLRSALTDQIGNLLTPAPPPPRERVLIPLGVEHVAKRTPSFCSGCPHNHSTRVPEGTLVGAGIGCHTMALLSTDERLGEIVCITAMGGEGAAWIGMSDFVETEHLTQNLGDGTYFHSGQLALQAAVAAGVNITYKLLYNGSVAMTGGQLPPGQLPISALCEILLAQGVAKIIVTSEDVSRSSVDIPAGVDVWDRWRIDEAQEVLAATEGVTVMIHDQACAAQLRRDRHRGLIETPSVKVMINERVCEGCGDCSEKSSCLSVQPMDTPFGLKTKIDQGSCNFDYSCLEGDCPAFITVEPKPTRWWHRFSKPRPTEDSVSQSLRGTTSPTDAVAGDGEIGDPALEEPTSLATASWRVRLVGIGGTGVVTVAQVIATAATMEGFEVRGLDQTGLSQKAGPVVSDLYLGRAGEPNASNHFGVGQADVLIALDSVVAADPQTLAAADPDRTHLVGSSSYSPVPGDPAGVELGASAEIAQIEAHCLPDAAWVDSVAAAQSVGLPATANMVVIGLALQRGLLPISPSTLKEAIELNAVGVESNLAALKMGRVSAGARISESTDPIAQSPRTLEPNLAAQIEQMDQLGMPVELRHKLGFYATELADFQDVSLASEYIAEIERCAQAEQGVAPGQWALSEAVMDETFRVTAYKDEYEVARLLVLDDVAASASGLVDQPAIVSWKLHPPVLKSFGLKHKISVGPWARPAMRQLARMKRLRGTPLDPFGRFKVRKAERRLTKDFHETVGTVLRSLTAANYEHAVATIRLSQSIRGYEDRKLSRIAEYYDSLQDALEDL